MRRSLHAPLAPGKALAVWVCLMAALLLWSPLWATAWHASLMNCCNGTQCPVHHHGAMPHKSISEPGRTDGEGQMECHHSGTPGMMTCAMSCCQEHEQAATGAVVFVLPDGVNILATADVVAAPSIM